MATLEAMVEGLQCPRCGRENTYVIRDTEWTEKVAANTVTVTVRAGVCTNCGEEALDSVATRAIQAAVEKLRAGAYTELAHMGEAYHA